ncbi:MAG TPA: Type 1 glutamine amidotransferase-like domain-containing protein, partial [Thermoanaerobaculia bacterium]|nr:Type 1 glutamine amidotransferase-like domain-containing protein [Thermoanaerobaculia bacterium]
MSTIKPIFLLADSQLLFWRDQGELFLGRIRALLDADVENAGRAPRAAYLGASNGDAPEFYQLFVAAMEQIGVHDCRQIPSQPDAEDLAFLAAADLLLLAGGEVRRGWDAFKAAGLEQKLVERYYGGALLIGLSAGAVQLGLKGWDETGERMSDMLRVVPFVVDVHDEPGWGRLLQAVPRAGEHARGFGIPSGGGAVYHPDYSVEPVRHPLV